jgi:hypothetical protein
MSENAFTQPAAPRLDRALIARSHPQIISGARWFWWIAGLSLVNSVLIHSGSDTSFVVGLGFTLIADSIFQELKLVAFAVDALAIGGIFVLGLLAGRGQLWAFVVGMILYALDALIYLPLEAWMAVAFHVLALVFIFGGFQALRHALKAAANPPVDAPPPPVVTA